MKNIDFTFDMDMPKMSSLKVVHEILNDLGHDHLISIDDKQLDKKHRSLS